MGGRDRSSGTLCFVPHGGRAVQRGRGYRAVDGDPWLGAEGWAASRTSFNHRDNPVEAGLSSPRSRDRGLAQGPTVSPRTVWHTGTRASGQSAPGGPWGGPSPPRGRLSPSAKQWGRMGAPRPLRPSSADPDGFRAIVTCQVKNYLL